MTRLRTTGVCWSLVAGVVALAGDARAATFAELAKYLPDGANAVVVINAEGIYASPIAQREGWQQKYADGFEAAPLILPPSAKRGVLAAAFDLRTLRPDWEAAAMELSIDPSEADIARRRHGRNDVLAGMKVAWIGNELCVLKFGAGTFGVITPASRQDAARWAEAVKAGDSRGLSPYLAKMVGSAERGQLQVLLAVDLADCFSEENLRVATAQAEALKGISPDEAASILASIQGVKFGVAVGEKLVGRVQLDFGKDVGPLAAVAKPVALKALAKAGATLPEFANWTAVTQPNSLALEGELTEDGMRRIFSLLAIDAATLESAEPEQATTTSVSADVAKQAMGKTSVRYYRAVGKYVEDIDRLQKAASLDQAGMWIENYARKVDSLPTRGVDADLVQYGKYVAATFRSVVDQASGAIAQVDTSGAPVVTDYRVGYLPTARTVNYGGDFQRMYAPYGIADIDPQATQLKLEQSQSTIDAAVAAAQKTLQQLTVDHKTVGTKLSEKYGVQF